MSRAPGAMAVQAAPKRRFLLVGVVLCTVIAIVVFLWSQLFSEDPPHLPDAELIAKFQKHRADFDQLRNMIVEDKRLLLVNQLRTLPEDPQMVGIGPSRIAEYRTLLRQLDIRGGIESSVDKKHIELTSSFRGMVTHNSQKGYWYSTEPITTYLSPDLDQFLKSESGVGYRHIEGSWYLFFQGY